MPVQLVLDLSDRGLQILLLESGQLPALLICHLFSSSDYSHQILVLEIVDDVILEDFLHEEFEVFPDRT